MISHREKVEIIRSAIDAWNRGDWDEAFRNTAPEFELDNSLTLGEWRGVHKGANEVKRMWTGFLEPWDSVHIEIDEFVDGGEHVVTRQTAVFRGRDGIEVEVRTGWCWTFRDASIVRLFASNELDDALEAAGLSDSR